MKKDIRLSGTIPLRRLLPLARYEERLKEFLEQIGELPNDYENVEDVLNEAVEVADLYGRLQPDKFREIWEKLNKRLRESKV